jgi:hypothetical protein
MSTSLNIGPAVKTILGGINGGKIFISRAPQETQVPYIIHFKVSNNPSTIKDRASSVFELRYQVSVFAKTHEAAQTLADACRDALDHYTGVQGTVTFLSSSYDGEQDLYEDDAEVHHIAQDYILRVKL